MTRSYPSAPLVGVGVVAFRNHDEILLVQRGQEPNKGLWALPGGMVELGERVRDAAVREVKEECNLDIVPEDVISVVDLILKDRDGKVKYHYILIEYLASYSEGELQPRSDVIDARWFSEAQLAELDIPEVTRKVIDKAFKIRKEEAPGK